MEQGINSLKQRAHHEAGHVIMAYFVGYSCKVLEITERNPLDNMIKYDFGKDTAIITAIHKYKNNPEIYDGLSEADKNGCQNVALKTIIVLLAGSAAESVCKSGGKVELNHYLTISVHDLNGADNIDYFLSIIKQGQHPSNYLQTIFAQVLKLLETKEIWDAISTLAKAIVESEDTRLERKDIEKILIETGFLRYLSSLRTGKPAQAGETSPSPSEEAPPAEKQASSGFTREELEKMKQQCKQNPPVGKRDGVVKIINFAKNMKYSNMVIGLTNDPENDLYNSGKIEKGDKTDSLVINTQSNAIAKEVMMYFVCLGMEIAPGSSKSNEATTVFVMLK